MGTSELIVEPHEIDSREVLDIVALSGGTPRALSSEKEATRRLTHKFDAGDLVPSLPRPAITSSWWS
jgi:hypothetical protein